MSENKGIKEFLERELKPNPLGEDKKSWAELKVRLDQRSRKKTARRITLSLIGISVLAGSFFLAYQTFNEDPTTLSAVKPVNSTHENSERAEDNASVPTYTGKKEQLQVVSDETTNNVVETDVHAKGNSPNKTIGVSSQKKPNSLAGISGSKPLADLRKTDEIHEDNHVDTPVISEQKETSVLLPIAQNESIPVKESKEDNSTLSDTVLTGERAPEASPDKLMEESSVEYVQTIPEDYPRFSVLATGGRLWSMRNSDELEQNNPNTLGVEHLALPSMDLGLNVKYRFRNNLTIQTGFNFYELKESYRYPGIDTTVTTVTQTGDWVVTLNHQWVYSDSIFDNRVGWIYTDSILQTTKDSNYVVTTDTSLNDYNLPGNQGINLIGILELPVLIGYEKKINKWLIGGQVGIGIEYMLYSSGGIYKSEISFLGENDIKYYRIWNFSGLAGLNVDYMLDKYVSVGFQPTVRIPLNPMVEDNDFSLKYHTFSMSLRIRYFIGSNRIKTNQRRSIN